MSKNQLVGYFSSFKCVGKELYIYKKEITQNESGHFERSSKLFLPTKGSSPKNHMVKILGIQKKGDIHLCRGFTLPPSAAPLSNRESATSLQFCVETNLVRQSLVEWLDSRESFVQFTAKHSTKIMWNYSFLPIHSGIKTLKISKL